MSEQSNRSKSQIKSDRLVARITRRLTAIAIFFSVSAIGIMSSANKSQAGGSLPLSDILPLINQSKKLTKEINLTLKNNQQTSATTACIGGRISGKLALGGARYAPFECRFRNTHKTLKIEAKNYIRLANGKLMPLEKLPDMSPQPENVELVMKLKSWRWQKSID
jgi:hypothetical protein